MFVNPWKIEDTTDLLARALSMSKEERLLRHTRDAGFVNTQTVLQWAYQVLTHSPTHPPIDSSTSFNPPRSPPPTPATHIHLLSHPLQTTHIHLPTHPPTHPRSSWTSSGSRRTTTAPITQASAWVCITACWEWTRVSIQPPTHPPTHP